MNSMRGILMVAVLTLGVIASAGAEDRSADISFSGTDIAAGVGFTWGDGTLHFNGNDYRFTVSAWPTSVSPTSRARATSTISSASRISPGTTSRSAPAQRWQVAETWRCSRTRMVCASNCMRRRKA